MGELPAGTPLRLDELARSLGMSISPIREAVRQLEALGLAKHVPHQGARVLDFDVEELRDLFQIRLALESLAVRRAAERFTDANAEAAPGSSTGSTPRPRSTTSASRCGRTRTSTSRSTTRRSRRGSCADPAGVGPLGALPAGAAHVEGRPAGAPPGASTRRSSTRAPRTIRRRPPRRCTTTSSSRA